MGIKEAKEVFNSPLRIRFRGQYDYDGLIALLRGFYRRAKMPIQEPKFKFKNGGTGAEVEFKFEGDLKVTHYIKIYLIIEGHGFDVQPKEVVINNQKRRLTEGKMELKFQGKFELDYSGMYKLNKNNSKFKNKMHQEMQEFMDNPDGISFGDNKGWGKKNIQKLVTKFHKETKQFLGMECV